MFYRLINEFRQLIEKRLFFWANCLPDTEPYGCPHITHCRWDCMIAACSSNCSALEGDNKSSVEGEGRDFEGKELKIITLTKMGSLVTVLTQSTNFHVKLASTSLEKTAAIPDCVLSLLCISSAFLLRGSRFSNVIPSGSWKLHPYELHVYTYFMQKRARIKAFSSCWMLTKLLWALLRYSSNSLKSCFYDTFAFRMHV